jgi:hypothetical protein
MAKMKTIVGHIVPSGQYGTVTREENGTFSCVCGRAILEYLTIGDWNWENASGLPILDSQIPILIVKKHRIELTLQVLGTSFLVRG